MPGSKRPSTRILGDDDGYRDKGCHGSSRRSGVRSSKRGGVASVPQKATTSRGSRSAECGSGYGWEWIRSGPPNIRQQLGQPSAC